MSKLISIAGPLCGGVFPLSQDAFSIGRSVNNTLCIEDPSVSRTHCVLSRNGAQFHIADRGSVNGTYINGLPLQEHDLRNGDEVKIGESLFLFVSESDDGAGEGEPTLVLKSGIHAASTQVLPAQGNARILGPAGRYFEALLSLGAAIPGSKGLVDLQRRILDSLCYAVAAQQGLLALAGDDGSEPAAVCEWPENVNAAGLSPAALLERLIKGPAILWNRGMPRAPDFSVSPSVTGLMAVPLIAFERFVGAICVTTSDPKNRFDDEHLQFLTKAGGISAGLLEDALAAENRETENRQRAAAVNLEHNMIGESPRMRKVYETIAKVAPTDSTVLIRGESGTGKELAARAIHRNSRRATKPFIGINCAALTETLLESELFGHEKGAFTGAVVQKRGKLEEAGGGTVFFDEVTEMSPLLQAKLLRVLQEREFERVGGTRSIAVDVRVIAATNRDLEDSIRRGVFRADLYYRLNVVSVNLPPLRDRLEDVELLANHFAQKHSRKLKRWISGISPQAQARLKSYDWPGNVRELENAIERAIVLGSTERIEPEDLPETVFEAGALSGGGGGGFVAGIAEAKKRIILEAIEKANGNYTEAARLLDLHPNSLHRMIRNLSLKARPAS
ncbi:MAG: sigma 54-interacting transcriptional regulator [Bryobacteraceae bacterium]